MSMKKSAVTRIILLLVSFVMGCQPHSSDITEKTQTLTITSTESYTQTATRIPTTTLISTPLGEDARAKVAYLLQTNGNCTLPCWWGITPGRTTWKEAESYLATFASQIDPVSYPMPEEHLIYYSAEFPVPSSISQNYIFFSNISVDESGIIETIHSVTKFDLSSALSFFGVPSQIWINIVPIFSPHEYELVLFYNSGIMMRFAGTTNRGDIDFIDICYEDIPEHSELWVWDPDIRNTNEVLVNHMGIDLPLTANSWFRNIQDVSDMQPQEFYDYFLNAPSSKCIQFPLSDW